MRRVHALALALAVVALSGVALGAGGAEGEHGGHAAPGEINWMHGFLGEKAGVEPSVLWRKPGTQPPLGALLLNTAILFYLLGRFGRKPVVDALKKRKATIMQGMDDAARMKGEAEDRLAEYEDKLAHIDDDIERVKREMQAAGEAERIRVLAEAKDKRARMERDARVLIEQELKVARDDLMRETIASAMQGAREVLEKQVSGADQERLAQEYVAGLDRALVNARGGRA